jgi:O-antigen/teichoic acid export membrane protein
MFALAPTYLKYAGNNRAMLRIVVGAAALQVILLAILVPRFAATGAALAYALSMSGMYLVFSRMAYRELVMLKSGAEG